MRVDYLDIRKAAELMGMTERHVRRMCEGDELKGSIKNGKRWKIPPTADARLRGAQTTKDFGDAAKLLDVPANKREKALAMLGVITEFEKFAAQQGGGRVAALKMFAAAKKIGRRSISRWLESYKNEGLLGLVDTRGGGKFVSQMISPDAFELFKSMYLTPQQRSIKICWQNVCYVNSSESRGWKVPSLQFMYRWIKRQIPLAVQILHREGLAAYQAKCAPYIETDPDSVKAGEVFIGDHHQFNCWIRHRGKWIRPWITAWADMRTRTIVGRHITAGPNQTTILIAFKRAVEKYGPPESVKIDNGKDYDSEMFTGTTKARRRALRAGYIDEKMVAGIYAMMDIGVSFSIKYHPQSKAIERWFDTLDQQFTKTMATYCGKDSARKPEQLTDMLKSEKAILAAYDLDSFAELVGGYVKVYNHTAHTGRGMENRSPAQVMAERTSRRVVREGVLDLLLRVWSGELKVGKNGVRFNKMSYGQYDPAILLYQGKKVRVAYDPDDLSCIHVYNAQTLKLIAVAEQNQLVGYGLKVNDEALREANRAKSRSLKVVKAFRDSSVTANMDLPSLTIKAMAQAAQEPPAASTETIRPVATVMDGQVAEHRRLDNIRAVRKAAGAEGISHVVDLAIDFDALRDTNECCDIEFGFDFDANTKKAEPVDLKLFTNE